MKKLLFLSILLLLVTFLYSQPNGDLFKQQYIRFGPSFPTKHYLGYEKPYWENTKRLGAVIEYGNIYMLNSIKLAQKLRFGINPDWVELKYHHLSTDRTNFTTTEGIISLSSKIGISLSYGISDDFIIDVYGKYCVPWLALYYYTEGDASANDLLMYGAYLGWGFGTGINLRYNFFMFSFEINKLVLKLEDSDYGGYLGDPSNPGSDKTPLPGFNLTFGFSF